MFKDKNELKLKREDEIQKELDHLIEKKKSLVFEAGAGSGKTYALKKSIINLLERNRRRLSDHNQKIIVITFTNAAADEVKTRIGESSLVLVSTIHERLWDIIRRYQEKLVEIHLDKLIEEIENIENRIEQEERFTRLPEKDKQNFLDVMLKNKDVFYDYLESRAADAREIYENLPFNFSIKDSKLTKNIKKFKTLVLNFYRKKRYESTVNAIQDEGEDYNEVEYNTLLNTDRLERMEIGHDTLLEYAYKIIKDQPLLQRIIIHKYPYFFVDEYQDTHPFVVKTLSILDQYAQKHNESFFVGYYGDRLQHIYDHGIGENLHRKHQSLKVVSKPFNRRSSQEVIDIINKIRDDGEEQKSIYNDATGGSVKFYSGKEEQVQDFIQFFQKKWNINSENPLDCLILTHRSISEYIGLTDLYNVFKDSPRYRRGQMYQRLNDELLSQEFDKLGDLQKIIHNLFTVINSVQSKGKTVSNILLTENMHRNISLYALKDLIASIQAIGGSTFGEFLKSLEKQYNKSNNKLFNELIDNIFNLDKNEIFDLQKFRRYILRYLGEIEEIDVENNKNSDKALSTLNALMSLKIEQFLKWYKFRMLRENEVIRYHTYHGTKGLEFKNVVIIMKNRFNRKPIFTNFLQHRDAFEGLELKDKSDFKEARNLLYVVTSRAIKNLSVLYIDDIGQLREDIEGVFGKIHEFSG